MRALACSSVVFAACNLIAISFPALARADDPDLKVWKSLLAYRPSESVQQSVIDRDPQGGEWAVHRIEGGGVGDPAPGRVSLDYYSVNITRLPKLKGKELTPEQLLEHVRLNLNDFVDSSAARFRPLPDSPNDAKLWKSSDATSAVLLIDIILIDDNNWCFDFPNRELTPCPQSVLTDYGCVVVAEHHPKMFRFSTIKAGTGWFALNDPTKPGAHPVSGNREFGFSKRQGQPGWSFYTIGADRATRSPDEFYGLPLLRDIGYSQADALWKSYREKLFKFVNEHEGEATMGIDSARRFDWATMVSDGLYKAPDSPKWVEKTSPR